MLAKADAVADDDGERERREAGIDLHDSPAREVEQPCRLEETTAPCPVGDGVVDERGPEDGEDDERWQPDALCGRRGDNRQRDGRERELEGREEDRRIGTGPGIE